MGPHGLKMVRSTWKLGWWLPGWKGTYLFPDGTEYEGGFIRGKNGQGTFKEADGFVSYDGEWKDGKGLEKGGSTNVTVWATMEIGWMVSLLAMECYLSWWTGLHWNHETRSSTRIRWITAQWRKHRLRRRMGQEPEARQRKSIFCFRTHQIWWGLLRRISKWNRKRVSGWRNTLLSGKLKKNLKDEERSIPIPVTLFLKEISRSWSTRWSRPGVPWKWITVYSGGFVKGLREGNGKLYGMNGVLIYEGQFKANRRHGSGKAFHENGKIAFEETGIPINRPWGSLRRKWVLIFQGALSKIFLKVRARNFEKTDLCSLKVPFRNSTWFRKNLFPWWNRAIWWGIFRRCPTWNRKRVPSWWNSDLRGNWLNGRRDGMENCFLKKEWSVWRTFCKGSDRRREWIPRRWVPYVPGRFSQRSTSWQRTLFPSGQHPHLWRRFCWKYPTW